MDEWIAILMATVVGLALVLYGKYELRSRARRNTVGGLYYDYLRMRYPKAKVFCRGETQPVTFSHAGVVRAVLMPIKE